MKIFKNNNNNLGTVKLFEMFKVLLAIWLPSFLVIGAAEFLTKTQNVQLLIFFYFYSLVTIFVLLNWIKNNKFSKEDLGLRKGTFNKRNLLLIGIVTGIFFTETIRFSPLQNMNSFFNRFETQNDILALLFFPISLNGGLLFTILLPISEAMLFLGFVYNVLRNKVGVLPALLLQALLASTPLIFSKVYEGIYLFLVWILLGFLYELTGSIYPSIVGLGLSFYLFALLRYCAWQ